MIVKKASHILLDFFYKEFNNPSFQLQNPNILKMINSLKNKAIEFLDNLSENHISENYVTMEDIAILLSDIRPLLRNIESNKLCEIYCNLLKLHIIDYNFTAEIRLALTERQDISYADLVSILKSTQKYQEVSIRDKEFLTEITRKLSISSYDDNIQSSINTIWCLAKMRYKDEDLFMKYKPHFIEGISSLDYIYLVKLTQSMAILNLPDEDILNEIIKPTKNKSKVTTQGIVHLSYYLTMILINNDVTKELREEIESFISNNISSINLADATDVSIQRPIFHIHCAKIITLSQSVQNKYILSMNTSTDICTSMIQKEVYRFIKKAYLGGTNGIEVSMEYFDPLTGFHNDILLKTFDDIYLYLEVDGPRHGFINRDKEPNGATIFRNKIHEICHQEPIITIDYTIIDNRNYCSEVLHKINSTLINLRNKKRIELEMLKSDSKEDIIETSDTKTKSNTHTNENNSKSKSKSKNKNKNKYKPIKLENSHEIINESMKQDNTNELQKPNLSHKYQFLLKQYKVKTCIQLLKKALSKNLKDAELVIDYCTGLPNNNDNYIETLLNTNKQSLLQETLGSILDAKSEETCKTLLQAYKLLLDSGYKPDFHESHVKALILSIKYGEIAVLHNIFSLIPDSKNKEELINLMFIISCALDNITVPLILLEAYHVNINCTFDESTVSNCIVSLTPSNNHKSSNTIREFFTTNIYNTLIQNIDQNHSPLFRGSSLETTLTTVQQRVVTPLIIAVYSKQKDTVNFLLENGATENYDYYSGSNQDENLLIRALSDKSEDIALSILNKLPINPNLTKKNGVSALHIATVNKLHKVVDALLSLGANPNKKIIADTPSSNEKVTKIDTKMELLYHGITPVWIALLTEETEIFLKLINDDTNVIEPIKLCYENNKETKYITTCMIECIVRNYELFMKVLDKCKNSIGNQHSLSSLLDNNTTPVKFKNFVKSNPFSPLGKYLSVLSLTLQANYIFRQILSNEWLEDEKVISDLSKYVNYIQKEDEIIKILQCKKTSQLKSILSQYSTKYQLPEDNINILKEEGVKTSDKMTTAINTNISHYLVPPEPYYYAHPLSTTLFMATSSQSINNPIVILFEYRNDEMDFKNFLNSRLNVEKNYIIYDWSSRLPYNHSSELINQR